MASLIVPTATLALSATTYKLVWLDDKSPLSLRTLVDTCLTNSAGWFRRDTISSIYTPQLKNILCIRLAFLKEFFNDHTGHAVFLIYGSILYPLILRLCYKAASPNTQSSLQGIILPALALIMTSSSILLLGSGVGVFIPAVISILYSLGASTSKSNTSKIPMPPVTQAVYGANLAVIASVSLFFLQLANGADVEGEKSLFEYYISREAYNILQVIMGVFTDVFPLIVSIPLIYLGLRYVRRPKSEAQAQAHLRNNYFANEVAYGFERAWAYSRQSGMLAAFGYSYGMSRVVRVNIIKHVPLPSSSKYLLLVSLSLALTHLSIVVTDAVTTPKDEVDEDARKAIAKAPAGNPGVDDNLLVLTILAFLAGPSLSAMLWYGRGEELRGWKGRRAWRLATSDKKSIKS